MNPIVIHFGSKTVVFYCHEYLAIYDPESSQDTFDVKMDVYEGGQLLGVVQSERETRLPVAIHKLIQNDLPAFLRPPEEPDYSLERPQVRQNTLRPAIQPEPLE